MVMDGNKYPSLLALGWTNPEALIMTSLIHFRCIRSLPFLSLSLSLSLRHLPTGNFLGKLRNELLSFKSSSQSELFSETQTMVLCT